jgi:hypothetical protein
MHTYICTYIRAYELIPRQFRHKRKAPLRGPPSRSRRLTFCSPCRRHPIARTHPGHVCHMHTSWSRVSHAYVLVTCVTCTHPGHACHMNTSSSEHYTRRMHTYHICVSHAYISPTCATYIHTHKVHYTHTSSSDDDGCAFLPLAGAFLAAVFAGAFLAGLSSSSSSSSLSLSCANVSEWFICHFCIHETRHRDRERERERERPILFFKACKQNDVCIWSVIYSCTMGLKQIK